MSIKIQKSEIELFLAKHNFFVEQIDQRVFKNFDDIDKEAHEKSDEVFGRIMSQPCDDNDDGSMAADYAQEEGAGYYGLLVDMKNQMMLAALGVIYAQWEKDVKSFLEREDKWLTERESLKCPWDFDFKKICGKFTEYGWNIRNQEWFPLVDACRLIVNVHKHGKGDAWNNLKKEYPQYIKIPVLDELDDERLRAHDGAREFLACYENLELTKEDVMEVASGFRQFWDNFPEELGQPE